MAEITLATLTQEQLNRLVHRLEDSALEIATLTAERDSARQQSTVKAPVPTNAPAQSEEPIVISSGTPKQNDSVGQRSGVASDGAAPLMPAWRGTGPHQARGSLAKPVGTWNLQRQVASTPSCHQCHSSRSARPVSTRANVEVRRFNRGSSR
ncbi:unnamed protein product [Closterium sp. NIES-54]